MIFYYILKLYSGRVSIIEIIYICRHHKAAKVMLLFVVAYFIQWWLAHLYGIWPFIFGGTFPDYLVHLAVILCNLGGFLNAGVYILIRRNRNNTRPDPNLYRQNVTSVRFRTDLELSPQVSLEATYQQHSDFPSECQVQQHDAPTPYLETDL